MKNDIFVVKGTVGKCQGLEKRAQVCSKWESIGLAMWGRVMVAICLNGVDECGRHVFLLSITKFAPFQTPCSSRRESPLPVSHLQYGKAENHHVFQRQLVPTWL